MIKGGIDIGFGDVKAVFSDGRKLKFPTAVALDPGGVINMNNGNLEEGLYAFNGANYYVGDTALHMGQTFSTRSMSFLESFAPLLIHVAIERAGFSASEVGEMAIGLPLGNFNPVSKAFLQKKIDEGNVGGKKLVFSRLEFLPQGVGVLLDSRLDGFGADVPDTGINTLIVDIGFNTVDVIVAINGQAKRGRSEMMERSGISWICDKLAVVVREKTTVQLTEQQAKEVLLKGGLKVYGKHQDLSSEVAAITNEYAKWLYSEITSRWEEQMKKFPKVILAGGGAHIVGPYFPRHIENLDFPPEPEFSNARGFLKWLYIPKKAA